MNPKKLPKPTKKDKAWQQKIEKLVDDEKVELTQPKGKERFEQAIISLLNKPKR